MGVRMQLSKWRRFAGVFALLAALTFALAACGGGDDESGGSTTEASGGSTQKTFPELKVAFDNGIDYLDPGLSYTVQGWGIMLPVHLGLVTYKMVNGPDGATLIPAMAKDMPTRARASAAARYRSSSPRPARSCRPSPTCWAWRPR